MPEQTGQQLAWGHGYGGTSLGIGYGLLPYKTDAGVAILPPAAAVRGSGALEGRNAYDYPVAGVGWTDNSLHGYGVAPAGTYAHYRLMLAHPTLALAFMAVTAPILAAGAKYEADAKRAPEGAHDLVDRVMSKMRSGLLTQMLRAVAIGCQSFEIAWGEDDGFIVPVLVKPLLPELTHPLVDQKTGALIGIQNGSVKLDKPGTWMHHAHDVEGTNWHGRGRLENVRRTLANALSDEDQLHRLGAKAAGIVVTVGHPPDTATPQQREASGYVSHHVKALQIAGALAAGKSVAFENVSALMMDDVEKAVGMAGKSFWTPTLMDMGDTSGAQAALIEQLRYADQKLCRGMGRSERSVIEANTAGSRADAEAHTADIGDTDADLLHEAACATINTYLIDPMLEENYGRAARGSVWMEPVQIVDEKRSMVRKFVDAMNGDPMLRAIAFQQIDFKALIAETGLKLLDDAPPIDADEIVTEGKEAPGGDEAKPNEEPPE